MDNKTEQDTRKEIIEASMRLFSRRGYHGTSVAQIAEATGLTKGALYWYFKGKEDLFLTVLEHIRDHWQKTIMSRVEACQGVIEKLEQLFEATSEMVAAAENPYSMHLFLVSAGAQPEMREFEDAIKAAYAGYVKTLAETIRAGQEDGEIRKDIDAQSIAVGIIGCLEGIVLQARLHAPAAVAAAIGEMKRQFIRSLSSSVVRASKKEKPAPLTADQLNLF
ncbi:MAG: TetR/AcrR family transcriptional regulator [Candidatus Abyssobacteria bacterium SURF_17]|jgi:TetR/AcrR family transcriptional repressor of nem operon|uniref:TetR/AcrR family transcriptional regulator n=1 Tax=Candidatus Abyssobacteria bacterium SURF_17 TaxID=2093361 RepID=A0A419F9B7_9BACT|nr:MAG: TetR/AcrR family transcriptional regulator [Candidatus Abyssubacteria bacterium SURF_17]